MPQKRQPVLLRTELTADHKKLLHDLTVLFDTQYILDGQKTLCKLQQLHTVSNCDTTDNTVTHTAIRHPAYNYCNPTTVTLLQLQKNCDKHCDNTTTMTIKTELHKFPKISLRP